MQIRLGLARNKNLTAIRINRHAESHIILVCAVETPMSCEDGCEIRDLDFMKENVICGTVAC